MNKLKSLDIVEANLEWLSMNDEVITSLDEFALKEIKKDLQLLTKESLSNLMLDTAEEMLKELFNGIEINETNKEDCQIIANVISEFGSRVIDNVQKAIKLGEDKDE